MPRSKGQTGKTVRQRESLENALAALVRVEYLTPITRLRITQARDSSGLTALLSPALAEMDDMHRHIHVAKREINAVLNSLPGEAD